MQTRPLLIGSLVVASFLSWSCRDARPALVALPPDAFAGAGQRALTRLEPARSRLAALEGQSSTPPADLAAAWAELAKLAHAFELYAIAEIAYRNAGLLAPHDGRWPYLEGQVGLAAGAPAAALAAFDRALAAGYADIRVRVARAGTLHVLGQQKEAATAIDDILAEASSNPGALLAGAKIAADLGNRDRAIERYEALRRLQPAATKINAPLALLYRLSNRTAEADEALSRSGDEPVSLVDELLSEVQALASTDAELATRAQKALDSNDLVEAERLLREAILVAPDSAGNQLNLLPLFLRSGRYAEAQEAIDRALAIEPRMARAWFSLGVLRARQGEVAGSLDAYRGALAIDERDSASRQNLANTLLRTGRSVEALAQYRVLLAQDPANSAARVGLAACLVASGHELEARRELERDFDPRTSSPQLAGALARLLAAAPTAGVRDGARAVELASGLPGLESNPFLLETLAMGRAETGDFASAIAAQERALALATASGGAPSALVERLKKNLARYRGGQAARDPAL